MQILLHLYEVEICQLSTANFVFYLFANYLPITEWGCPAICEAART
jgi:hypothetical protein